MCTELYNTTDMKDLRRQLRKDQTEAEEILWQYLRARKFENLKFQRQYSISKFIVDFYCPQEKLAIELDGQIHLQQDNQISDHKRTEYLNSLGIEVIRFDNKDVLNHIDKVLTIIKNHLRTSPLLYQGEGQGVR